MIKRTLFSDLLAHLDKKEISLLVGPRQSGKTTLLFLLKDYLEKRGDKCVYLNLDIESDKRYFESQEVLLNKISLEVGTNKAFIFLDEIQRKENAGLFLKGLYDMSLPYKFIISGSGSVELKEKIHESLAGRKRLFELSTLSFEEFVNYKTEYKYENKLDEFFKVESNRAHQYLYEYLNYGGYPRVVLEETEVEKTKIISELYQSYVEKDIVYLLNVQKTEDFTRLVKILASQVGKLLNNSELSATLGLSVPTVRNYLWYLEKTYITYRVTPFFRNTRKEITKSPVIYFSDLGLRNYANGTFGSLSNPSNIGFLFQNFVANKINTKLNQTSQGFHFWRTKDRAEVDFIIEPKEDVILPIEVKFKVLKTPEISRSLHSFISKYNTKEAIIVHLGEKSGTKVGNTVVKLIPFYEEIQLS
jgi:hypothetical protein